MRAVALSLSVLFISAFSHAECQDNIIPSISTGSLLDQGNGTLLDTRTGLQWSNCLVGQEWNGQQCEGEAVTFARISTALEYVNINLPGWRVPSIKELLSLVDYSCSFPAARAPLYPADSGYSLISSTPNLEETQNFTHTKCIWGVSFDEGRAFCSSTSDLRYYTEEGGLYLRVVNSMDDQ